MLIACSYIGTVGVKTSPPTQLHANRTSNYKLIKFAELAKFTKLAKYKLINICLQELLECIKQLLKLDRSWLPEEEGYSIYIRPNMFASSHTIGVHKTPRTTLSVILSPSGEHEFLPHKHASSYTEGKLRDVKRVKEEVCAKKIRSTRML